MTNRWINCYVPLRLPGFLLESYVYRLCDGGFHEVDVADDLWSEHVTDVAVKLAKTQTLCDRTVYAYTTHNVNCVIITTAACQRPQFVSGKGKILHCDVD